MTQIPRWILCFACLLLFLKYLNTELIFNVSVSARVSVWTKDMNTLKRFVKNAMESDR